MPSKPVLYSIAYSPWSLRAKWALRFQGVAYESREYVIMLSGPLLRLKLKRFSRQITVPLLVDGKKTYDDSREIVRYADSKSAKPPLDRTDEKFETVLADAELVATLGRTLSTRHIMRHREALIDSLPSFIPHNIFGLPVAAAGAYYIAQKYDFKNADEQETESKMRDATLRLQERLGDRPFFFERLTFADIAVATALQFVKPERDFVKLGDDARVSWTRSFADEVEPLLVWRDRFFAEHHWHN